MSAREDVARALDEVCGVNVGDGPGYRVTCMRADGHRGKHRFKRLSTDEFNALWVGDEAAQVSAVGALARVLYNLNPDLQPWDGDAFGFNENRGGMGSREQAELALRQAVALAPHIAAATAAARAETLAEVRAAVKAMTPMVTDEEYIWGQWLHCGDMLDLLAALAGPAPGAADEGPARCIDCGTPHEHHAEYGCPTFREREVSQ